MHHTQSEPPQGEAVTPQGHPEIVEHTDVAIGMGIWVTAIPRLGGSQDAPVPST